MFVVLLVQGAVVAQPGPPPPRVDHHQHLFSPSLAALISPGRPQPPVNPITAADLLAHLDAAGIDRAVVLSTAYAWSQPSRRIENDYERVRADNDWTSHEVSMFPDRLIGLCAVDPLEDWADEELRRCSGDPYLRHGVKMHIGNAAANYRNTEHVARLRQAFRAANDLRMPIVVHVRASLTERLPYGRDEASIFLEQVLPSAPDVPIQIAHLAGAGGYTDPDVEDALSVFVDAVSSGDPRTKNLWFDVTGVAMTPLPRQRARQLAQQMRRLGIPRILYGSDAPVVRNTPAEAWAAFRRLPLTNDEFRTIATNVAPYVRD